MAGFEDIYDALWGLVDALGGPKKVGPRLRPGFAGADQWLRNCLNRDHAQNLAPHHVQLLQRMACDAGYHDAKHWSDQDAGYSASVPMTIDAQFAVTLKNAQAAKRRAEETESNLRDLIANPEFLAWANRTGLKVEA